MRKEHVENVPVYCSNMQNELRGKWHFASFSVVVFSFRSGRLAGWSFGLGAMRFISKMTHFTMLEANIHTQAHTRE